jgi:ribonucleoside-triphosphate reductase
MNKYKEDKDHNLVLPDGTIILEKERTRCEVYSRVVEYLRPVSQYNAGKKSEFKDRKNFKVKEETKEGRKK